MSWNCTDIERLRLEFVMIALEPSTSVTECCHQFGISRKTGHKWMNRYRESGLAGLSEHSRRPFHIPKAISANTALEVVRLKKEHPFWGPKKIHVLLDQKKFADNLPSISTIARILRRVGLTEAKGRGRRKSIASPIVRSNSLGSNDVWTTDLKGWWKVKDGSKCEPLTVCDLFSRYILCLRPTVSKSINDTIPIFTELFTKYGIPKKIRCDNGTPFASVMSPHGLTRLSAWWKSLGIELERIQPGHPEQNGTHERMHLDVAKEIESSPARNLLEEEVRLEIWRSEYNNVRPHEALDMKVPGALYRRSSRNFPRVKEYPYDPSFEIRKINKDGMVRINGKDHFVSESLSRQSVGLEKLECNLVKVWFCDLDICEIKI